MSNYPANTPRSIILVNEAHDLWNHFRFAKVATSKKLVRGREKDTVKAARLARNERLNRLAVKALIRYERRIIKYHAEVK